MSGLSTIFIGSSKGGAGKSVLTFNIAIAGLIAGQRVCVIDADTPQQTLRKLIGVRAELHQHRTLPELRTPNRATPQALRHELSDLDEKGFQLALVDVGGYRADALFDAAYYANMWVIPVEPTLESFWGMEDSLGVETGAVRKILLNRVPLRTNRRLKDAFTEAATNLPLMMAKIHHRPDIPTSSYYGLGVTEYRPGSNAANEIWAVYNEIMREVNHA